MNKKLITKIKQTRREKIVLTSVDQRHPLDKRRYEIWQTYLYPVQNYDVMQLIPRSIHI